MVEVQKKKREKKLKFKFLFGRIGLFDPFLKDLPPPKPMCAHTA